MTRLNLDMTDVVIKYYTRLNVDIRYAVMKYYKRLNVGMTHDVMKYDTFECRNDRCCNEILRTLESGHGPLHDEILHRLEC